MSNRISDACRVMEKCLSAATPELLMELYKFGEQHKELSKQQILQIWNGVPLSKFDLSTLKSLFVFLTRHYNIGDVDDYFDLQIADGPEDVDRKKIYLASLTEDSQASAASILLKASTNIEKIFGKDLAELNKDELKAGLTNLGYTQVSTTKNAWSIIKGYIKWCKDAGYYAPAADILSKIKITEATVTRSIRRSLIYTPKEVKDILLTIRNLDGVLTSCILACLYWMGFTADEAYELRKEDVDVRNHIINNSHYGKIKIPDEFLPFFLHYNTSEFIEYYLHPHFDANWKESKRKNQRLAKTALRDAMRLLNQDYKTIVPNGVSLTMKTFRICGACWRIYEREKRDEDINRILFQFEFGTSSDKVINNMINIYEVYRNVRDEV